MYQDVICVVGTNDSKDYLSFVSLTNENQNSEKMRSSIIRCCLTTTTTRTGKKSKIFSLFYFLLVINLCSSSFNGDKNNFNNNHFTTHHPLRHHRHHALNRTSSHIIPNYYHHHQNQHQQQHQTTKVSSATAAATTRSPIESVRNFLTSREYDTKRNYFRAAPSPVTTKRPTYTASQKISVNQPVQRNHRNTETYQKVKEKTFDDIIREISQFKKRKRFHKTSTSTTTTTTEPSVIEDDYDYDDEDFQDDEGGAENTYLLPERQTSSERYNAEKKVSE